MRRLDVALVELKLAPSRTKAQNLIESGAVEVQVAGEWQQILQSSYSLKEDAEIRVQKDSPILKYVSRGGLKLEAALDELSLDVQGFRCLDVGLSTGGFSDCLLMRGAAGVVGLDVGHDQLAAKLLNEPKLSAFFGLHVRDLPTHQGIRKLLEKGLDLCVVDVSFISILQALPFIAEVLPPQTRLLALVKPQFEVGAKNLNKSGVVKDAGLFADVETQVLRALEKCGFSIEKYFPCAVKGQDGNQEFFVFAIRS